MAESKSVAVTRKLNSGCYRANGKELCYNMRRVLYTDLGLNCEPGDFSIDNGQCVCYDDDTCIWEFYYLDFSVPDKGRNLLD